VIQANRRLLGILVTFRRPEQLAAMLVALASQDRRLDHLVVVDNDPTPTNERIVRQQYPNGDSLEYLPSPENLGPAGGIALGMDRVLRFAEDRDWIVLVDDNDPPFSTTLLGDLAHFGESMLARDPLTAGVGRVGARFDWTRGRLIAMGRISNEQPGDAVAVDTIGGGHFPFYLARAVRSVGLFSSELFFGGEELEFGLRMREAGFSLYADASLWRETMKVDGTIGRDNRPSLRLSELSWRRYYDLRNLVHILRSFRRSRTAVRISLVRGIGKPLANVFLSPRMSMKHLKMNLRACRDAWTGRLGRTLEPEADQQDPRSRINL
jgi:glycosyltransferase involved in cell wall biosynthesis